MQAFKLFFRIVAKNKSAFLIYVGTLIGVTALFVTLSGGSAQGDFAGSRPTLTVINRDGGELGRGLESYLRETTLPADLEDDEGARLDALYFGQTDYILTIPEGFTQRLLAGESELGLERRSSHNAMARVQVELLVSRYLNLARAYLSGLQGLDAGQLDSRVRESLRVQAHTRLLTAPAAQEGSLLFYLRYYAYAVLSILILCVSSVMLAVGSPEIRLRSAASPLPLTRQTLQLILASLLLTLGLWALLSLFGLALYGRGAHPGAVRLLLANSLAFTVTSLCMSFMLAALISNRQAQSAVANVVALSSSFLSGVFVPQSLLSPFVQRLASLLPAHWYVRAIDALEPGLAPGALALDYSREGILIQLGFSAAFLSLALLGAKKRGLAPSRSAS